MSLFDLILDEYKPYLNARVNNLTVDGDFIQNGATGSFANVGAKVSSTANQSISNNTLQLLAFDNSIYDTDNMFNNAEDAIDIKTAGVYNIGCFVNFAPSSASSGITGTFGVAVYESGTNLIGVDSKTFLTPNSTFNPFPSATVSSVIECQVGNRFQVYVSQTTGGSLSISGNGSASSNDSPTFWAQRIA